MVEIPTTQRAYTLRLRGTNKDDPSWRDALWATHEAVNRGAKVFGDWLLTLRGGLDHSLANEGPAEQKADRRILLALSWLTVEDARGAPPGFVVTSPVESLREILSRRGVNDDELEAWAADCQGSLLARIREDGIWVNRSAAFDEFVARTSGRVDRKYATQTVLRFLELKGPYFELPSLTEDERPTAARASDEKPLVNEATGWLCDNWGAGKKSDKEGIASKLNAFSLADLVAFEGHPGVELLREICRSAGILLADDADAKAALQAICRFVGWKGRPSAARLALEATGAKLSLTTGDISKLSEKLKAESSQKLSESTETVPDWMPEERARLESRLGIPYRLLKDNTFEFAVMLDHALRKVSSAHSGIKNAEAERRQFENDAKRIADVPPQALAWLEAYCRERSSTSGALEPYRIRKRAIDGWDKVVQAWSRQDCQTPEARILAARQLQDDPEIDKFGDIQLFEALAADDAQCVWKASETPTPQPLRDFVAGTDAQEKRTRFKVPAYRHPDPLRHPVFTDFGDSRWHIGFSAHRAPAGLDDLSQKVRKLAFELSELENKRQSVSDSKRQALELTIAAQGAKVEKAKQELSSLSDRHRMELKLWNGTSITAMPLRWSCKRLVEDLSLTLPKSNDQKQIAVARADRLGRAAVGLSEADEPRVSGLFEQKHWNGRLQAPRDQLDRIAAHVAKHGWDAKAHQLIRRLPWLVSFSAELTPHGPWVKFCEKFNDDAPARPFVSRNGDYAVKHVGNDQRKGHAKLALSRLPGLRVLAVDLGHRYAAACAVWEAVTKGQMDLACGAAGVVPPTGCEMFVQLKGKNAQGKPTSTVYRRIGPDILPDGTPHAAAWARLDRQFVIKLQGEDRPARKASRQEIELVEEIEKWAGRIRRADEPARELSVDVLMNDAVRTARLAVARHGRRARIAHNLTTPVQTFPGGRLKPLDDKGRIDLLTDTLSDWHALATDDRWNDSAARTLWNERLAELPGDFAIQPRQERQPRDELTRVQRRKAEEALRERLAPLARALSGDTKLREELHDVWAARWQSDDDAWKKKLKCLSRWLVPRGVAKEINTPDEKLERVVDHEKRGRASNVGGVSLARISTLTEFRRKVQVGFYTRMKPDGARKELSLRFGSRILETIQRLKDNRVKQLASRIVEAALGIGIERHSENGRDLPRPRQQIDNARFAPCHAVVIEDLSHYRPEETRTRRENRATMDWKSAEARKRLADHCQLYGLHLRDVNPQYTSRQDSRASAPGVRCVDVPIVEFFWRQFWRKQVAVARRRAEEKKGDARDRYLLALDAKWSAATDDEKRRGRPLRIPLKGGEIFVSADRLSPLARGIQADLNAAANIGLRALTDPDFPGKWWYVPCDPKTRQPKSDKVKGAILDNVGPLQVAPSVEPAIAPKKRRASDKGDKKEREVINLWRDPQTSAIQGASDGEIWRDTSAYWNIVQFQVVKLLRNQSGLSAD